MIHDIDCECIDCVGHDDDCECENCGESPFITGFWDGLGAGLFTRLHRPMNKTEANNIWTANQIANERMANLVGGFDDERELT